MQKLKSIWLILLIYPFKMKGITTWPVHKSMGRNAISRYYVRVLYVAYILLVLIYDRNYKCSEILLVPCGQSDTMIKEMNTGSIHQRVMCWIVLCFWGKIVGISACKCKMMLSQPWKFTNYQWWDIQPNHA